jgi:hypothetical protein
MLLFYVITSKSTPIRTHIKSVQKTVPSREVRFEDAKNVIVGLRTIVIQYVTIVFHLKPTPVPLSHGNLLYRLPSYGLVRTETFNCV